MHILLTDVLTCPRCGPEFGLIALADDMDERRVVAGRLGCANCREEFTVHGGVADLRLGGEVEKGGAIEGDERAYRTAALLGVGQGMGTVLVLGGSPDLVDSVDDLLPNALVIGGGLDPDVPAAGAGWILHGERLPFRDGSLRGVALLGSVDPAWITEAARVTVQGARVVLDPAPAGAPDLLANLRLTVILDQDDVVVASAPGAG
jgi:uncharacterized protein YbaR (Trm112 family)